MNVKQVIVVRKDLNMRKGKIAAQAAHASMKFLADCYDPNTGSISVELDPSMRAWFEGMFTKIVVSVDSEQALLDLVAEGEKAGIVVRKIIDSGKTEFNGVPTLTCAAFGPDDVEKLDAILRAKTSLL